MAGSHQGLECLEFPLVLGLAGLMAIFDLAFPIYHRRARLRETAMVAETRLQELLQLPYSQLKELPESSSQDILDEEGKPGQIVTWREQMGPESCRIVVSQHRVHSLGISSLCSARGFTITSSGTIEMLDPADAERLFL